MFKQYLCLVLLLSGSFSILGMQQEDQDNNIEINGESKPLIGHIVAALNTDPNHLKTVDFIRYENDKYYLIAEGEPNLSENDLENIGKNNFVYTKFYALKKRGGIKYENIGAVIIGTKDKEHLDKIVASTLHSLLGKSRT